MKDVQNKWFIICLMIVPFFDVAMYNWHILYNDSSEIAWRIYDVGQSLSFAAYIAVIYGFVHYHIKSKWIRSFWFGWVFFAISDVIDEIFFKNKATENLEYWTLLAFIFGIFVHATGRKEKM